jgi:hypothetical protein
MAQINAEISTFEVLAQIAEANRITDVRWATAAGLTQPRIGELRQISRIIREDNITQAQASLRIKRSCTLDKIYKLYDGLRKLLGEEIMRHEIEKILSSVKDPWQRVQILAKTLSKKDCPEVEKALWQVIDRPKKKAKK